MTQVPVTAGVTDRAELSFAALLGVAAAQDIDRQHHCADQQECSHNDGQGLGAHRV
jgi:hypothetical protein